MPEDSLRCKSGDRLVQSTEQAHTGVVSYPVGFHIPVHHGIDGKPRNRLDAELLGNVLAVRDDRRQTDVQLVGYFLVDKPLGNEYQYLYLTGRQIVALLHFLRRYRMMCRFVSLFSHLHDGSHQFVLWQTDIQGRDTVQQRLFARCQHDGLRTAFQKNDVCSKYVCAETK